MAHWTAGPVCLFLSQIALARPSLQPAMTLRWRGLSLLPLLALLALLCADHRLPLVVSANQFIVSQGGCVCVIAAANTTRTPGQPATAVTADNMQSPFEFMHGVPSLAILQQHALDALLAPTATGSSAEVDMALLQAAFPQMQGGPIVCNTACRAPTGWSRNDDFLTMSIGTTGQMCGIHASGPYSVECIGDNSNSQLDFPEGLQALQIGSGDYNSCAITANRSLVTCWGGLGTRGEWDVPPEFADTDGSYTIEWLTVGMAQACAIGRRSTIDPRASYSNLLRCWGEAGAGGEWEYVIPALEAGVHWIQVSMMQSALDDGGWGLGLDSEGKVWNLPPKGQGWSPGVAPQSQLFPMVSVSMSSFTACGIAAGTMQSICWITPYHAATLDAAQATLAYAAPTPPPSMSLLTYQWSAIQCYDLFCAGVASNAFNTLVLWGAAADNDAPAGIYNAAPYFPRQSAVSSVVLGHDMGCVLGLDAHLTCFSTAPSIPFDDGELQDLLFVRDAYTCENPFVTPSLAGLPLSNTFQFAGVGVAKGLMAAVEEYLPYLSNQAFIGCAYDGPPSIDPSSIATGGFYNGVFGMNYAGTDLTQGASLLSIAAAAGYYCTLNTARQLNCDSYEQQGQGVVITTGAGDPRGANTTYASMAVGQGFYCLLRDVDQSLWCNNVTVSVSGLGMPNSIDVGLAHWAGLPQFASDPSVRATPFASIGAGDIHFCGIFAANSTVRCWGQYVNYTRSGPENILINIVPIVPVPAQWAALPFAMVTGGTRTTCGILAATREAVCWGTCDANQCDVPLKKDGHAFQFDSIDVGSDTVCAITADSMRELVCWGGASSKPPAPSCSSTPSSASSSSLSESVVTAPSPAALRPLSGLYPLPSTVATFAPLNAYAFGAEIRLCPAGTTSISGGMTTSLCSGGCPAGGNGSRTPLEATLEIGSATVGSSLCAAANSCPQGHYCPGGSSSPVPCPAGRFGSSRGLLTPLCDSACVAGYYCPAGTAEATTFPCPPGRFGNVSGLSDAACSGACSLGYYCLSASREPVAYACPNAGFYCPPASGKPVPADDGFFTNTTLAASNPGERMTMQLPCPAGHACQSGVATPCATGTYNASIGASICSACEQGKYAPAEGSTSCALCNPGTFNAVVGQGSCQSCPQGQAQPASGRTACESCEPGTSSLGAQPSCSPCPANTYAPAGGITCTRCPPPNLVDVNRTACLPPVPCAPGYFTVIIPSDGYDMGACRECPPGTFSGQGVIGACTVCARGTYTLTTANRDCRPCPAEGISCETVFGLGLARVNSGYWAWLEDDTTAFAAPCPDGFCTGDNLLISPDISNWTHAGLPLGLQRQLRSQTPCSPHRDPSPSNALCGACSRGYEEWRGECVSCPGIQWGVLLLLLFFSLLLVVVLHLLAQRNNGDTKVFLYFLQASLLHLGSADDFLRWLGLLNLDVAQTTGSTCVGPLSAYELIFMRMLLPFGLLVELALICAVAKCFAGGQSTREKEVAERELMTEVEGQAATAAATAAVLAAQQQLEGTPFVLSPRGSTRPSIPSSPLMSPVKSYRVPPSPQQPRPQSQQQRPASLKGESPGAAAASSGRRGMPALSLGSNPGASEDAYSYELRESLLTPGASAAGIAEDDFATGSSFLPASGAGSGLAKSPAAAASAPLASASAASLNGGGDDGHGHMVAAASSASIGSSFVAVAGLPKLQQRLEEGAQASDDPSYITAQLRSLLALLGSNFFPTSSASFIRTSLALYLISYQSVTTSCLQFLECVPVAGGERVLFQSPSIRCTDAEYHRYLPLVWVLLVLDVVAGPLLLLLMLWRHRHTLRAQDQRAEAFRAKYGVLYEAYTPRAFYYVTVVQLRHLLLVVLSVALHNARSSKFFAFALMDCASLAVHAYIQPFVRRWDNLGESLALQLLVFEALTLLTFTPPYSGGVQLWLVMLVLPFVVVWAIGIAVTRVQRQLEKRSLRRKIALEMLTS